MEERGHLEDKYKGESREPDRDLWSDIDKGIERKRRRIPIFWWWTFGACLLLGGLLWSGWEKIWKSNTIPTETVAHEGRESARISENKDQVTVENGTNVESAMTPKADEIAGKDQPNPRIPEKETERNNVTPGTTKRQKNRPSNTPTGKLVIGTTPAGKPDRETYRKKSDKPSLAISIPVKSKYPAKQNVEKKVVESLGKVKGDEIDIEPNLNNEKDRQLADNSRESTLNAATVSKPTEMVNPEVPGERIATSVPAPVEAIPTESTLKIDSLVKVEPKDSLVAVADTTQRDSSGKAEPGRKWTFGIGGHAWFMSKHMKINQSPDIARLNVENANGANAQRVSYSISGFISRVVASQVSVYARPGILFLQDMTVFEVNTDKIIAYEGRKDASGNQFVKPVFATTPVQVTTQKWLAQMELGTEIFTQKRMSLKIGWRMSYTASTIQKIIADPSNSSEPKDDAPLWNQELTVGIPIRISKRIRVEPGVSYFVSPVLRPATGAETRPILSGIGLYYLW